jgi:hypothetical protein
MSQLSAPSVGTLEPQAGVPLDAWDGPRCEKCEAPINPDQLVCKSCGYYASLGIFVEIDSQWEAVAGGGSRPQAQESAIATLHRSIPAWAWWLLTFNLAIVIASVVARFTLPDEGSLRTYVSVTMFIAGVATAILCHATCFVLASTTDVDMGLLDMVVNPLKGWVRVWRQLPKKLWLVLSGSCGVTSSLCAALIIGGIPFHVLLDWNFKQPPKQSLMGAVMAQAQKAPGGKDNLEEAIGDLAGKAGVTGEPIAQKPKAKAKARQTAECLVIGYKLDDRGNLAQLLLAMKHKGKLTYCGYVMPRLDPKEERELLARFGQFPATRSFVPTDKDGVWIQPRFTCRVTYTEANEKGRLSEIEWDTLMAELNVPW